MNCPFCSHPDTRVTDSRPDEGGIRRRRECLSDSGGCGRRFSTLERVELGGVSLVKKDGQREEFDREKIIAGVRKACEKRPIPSGAIEALADGVEKDVYAQGKAEVPSSFVGELVMERLRALDHIAYIRFASVYRAFADVDELADELAALKAGWTRPDVSPDQLALLPDVSSGAPAKQKRRRARRTDKNQVVVFPNDRTNPDRQAKAN
ncbi:MAG: transcriptional regulator NrdR [Dehalococcoidia bacterium]